MNKSLSILFFCALIISCSSAGFFNFLQENNQDFGEQQFSGEWDDKFLNDNGETTDQGEFIATVTDIDEGEYQINGQFQRWIRNYQYNDQVRVSQENINDNGEFTFVSIRATAKIGKPFTEEEIVPPTIKRLKKY